MQLASARCNRQDAAVSVFFGWMSVKTVEYANFATGTDTAWVGRLGLGCDLRPKCISSKKWMMTCFAPLKVCGESENKQNPKLGRGFGRRVLHSVVVCLGLTLKMYKPEKKLETMQIYEILV